MLPTVHHRINPAKLIIRHLSARASTWKERINTMLQTVMVERCSS